MSDSVVEASRQGFVAQDEGKAVCERNVFFRDLDGKTLSLSVDQTTTVEDVKACLVSRYQEQFKTNQLAAVQPESIVAALWSMMFFASCCIRSDDLFLSWNGKILNEKLSLVKTYQIPSGATVHVSCRRLGGNTLGPLSGNLPIALGILLSMFLPLLICPCTCGLSLLSLPLMIPIAIVLAYMYFNDLLGIGGSGAIGVGAGLTM